MYECKVNLCTCNRMRMRGVSSGLCVHSTAPGSRVYCEQCFAYPSLYAFDHKFPADSASQCSCRRSRWVKPGSRLQRGRPWLFFTSNRHRQNFRNSSQTICSRSSSVVRPSQLPVLWLAGPLPSSSPRRGSSPLHRGLSKLLRSETMRPIPPNAVQRM